MGNYLLNLRATPTGSDDDERNHPLYHDWSLPEWSPFKTETSNLASSSDANDRLRGNLAHSAGGASAAKQSQQATANKQTSASNNNDNTSQLHKTEAQNRSAKAAGKTFKSGAAISEDKSAKDATKKNLKSVLTNAPVVDTTKADKGPVAGQTKSVTVAQKSSKILNDLAPQIENRSRQSNRTSAAHNRPLHEG